MRKKLAKKQKTILVVGIQLLVIALLFGIGYYKTEKQKPILVPLEQFTTVQGNATVDVSDSQIAAFSETELTEGDETILRSAPMTLRRGSYLVKAEYESSSGANSITLISSQNATGIMESSRPGLASKNTQAEFPVTFRRGVQDAQIELSYASGAMTVTKVAVYATAALWNAWVLMLLLGIVILDILGWLIKNGSKQQIACYAMVVAIGLFASLPLFTDFFTPGIDLGFHLTRIEGLKEGLLSGQFPVRIQPPWYGGTGYPVSVMYGDALLYFPAILRILGLSLTSALNIFRIALNLLTATFAYIAFYKIFRSPNIGLMGAGLYTLNLYRFTNLLNRGALGEVSAMAFFPLVLLGLYQIYFEESEKEHTGWLWLTLGLSGLINSHILSCELAAGMMLLWALVFLLRTFRWNTWREFVKAGIATFALNLWFLLPFLDYSRLPLQVFTKEATNINSTGLFLPQIFSMFPNVTGQEVSAQYGYFTELGYSLGPAFLVGIFVLLYGLYINWKEKRDLQESEAVKLGIGTAAVGGAILAASLAVFPWDLLQRLSPFVAKLVSTLQLLSRLLTPASAVLALGTCCGMWLLCRKKAAYRRELALMMCLLSIVSSMYFFDEGMARTWDARRFYDKTSLNTYTNHVNEYLYENTDPSRLSKAVTYAEEPNIQVESSSQEYLTLTIQCKNTGEHGGHIITPLLYYPYYYAQDMESGAKFPVSIGANNLLQFELPAGFQGAVKVFYQEPWLWRFAETVSLLSLVGIVGWQVIQRKGDGEIFKRFQKRNLKNE